MVELMERAIDLALINVKEGGQPFGAVLAKGEEVIAEGVNELHIKHDVSGHAELLTIRRAQEKLATDNLSGFTMYASGEPCPMCLAAMYFAGITDIYFCETLDDAVKAGLGTSREIYDDLAKQKANRAVQMTRMPLEQIELKPIDAWVEEVSNK